MRLNASLIARLLQPRIWAISISRFSCRAANACGATPGKLILLWRHFFPGYLFIRLDLTLDRWRSVNSTYGVSNLVMQGAAPAAVPPGTIEELKSRCDSRGVIDLDTKLRLGQPVRILAGAMADFVGEFESQEAVDRVRLLLTILGKSTFIVLPRNSIAPESN